MEGTTSAWMKQIYDTRLVIAGIYATLKTLEDRIDELAEEIKVTPHRVLISNAEGYVIAAEVTTTELLQLQGITQNIQQSLDNKMDLTSNQTANGNKTFNDNIIIQGNLTVNGTQTIVDTDKIELEDNLILINRGQTGHPLPDLVGGIEISRGVDPNYQFIFEENTLSFKIGLATQLQPVATRLPDPYQGSIAYWNTAANQYQADNLFTYDDNTQTLLVSHITQTTATPNTVPIYDTSQQLMSSNVTTTTLSYLNGVSSNLQDQLDSKQAIITGAASTVTDNNLLANRVLVSDIITGKITTSNTTISTLSYLNDVTSNLQDQLNAKQAVITGAASTVTTNNLNPNVVLVTNGTGKITNGNITTTTLAYLDGVTSNLQNQLNAKQANITGAASTVTINNLLVNRVLVSDATTGKITTSNTSINTLNYLNDVTSNLQDQLNSKQAVITGAASTVTINNLTPSKIVVSDTAGKLVSGLPTVTEANCLVGTTSNLQTQLNNKLSLSGGTITGSLDLVGIDPPSILSAQVVNVKNNIITLNANMTGTVPSNFSAGVVIRRSDNDDDNASFLYNEGTKYWQVGIAADQMQTITVRADSLANNALVKWNTTTSQLEDTGVTVDTLGPNYVLVTDNNTRITGSIVTVDELSYLSGVTSNVQGQIVAVRTTADNAISAVTTSSQSMQSDLTLGNHTLTTQKATITDTLIVGNLSTGTGGIAIFNGLNKFICTDGGSNNAIEIEGTSLFTDDVTLNSKLALNGKFTLSGDYLEITNLNGHRALISGYSDTSTTCLAESITTDTELSYVSGVTSNIQTQLNDKLSSTTVINQTLNSDLAFTKTNTLLGIGNSTTAINTLNVNADVNIDRFLSFNGKAGVTFTDTSGATYTILPASNEWNICYNSSMITTPGTYGSIIFKINATGDVGITGNLSCGDDLTVYGNVYLDKTSTLMTLGSVGTVINTMTFQASTNKDQFLDFRTGGGSPTGKAGVIFRNFDGQSYTLTCVDNLLQWYSSPSVPTIPNTFGTSVMKLNSSGELTASKFTSDGDVVVTNNLQINSLSGDKALVSAISPLSDKYVTESSVTTTELTCLSGVTSNIQTQLNAIASFPVDFGNTGVTQTGMRMVCGFGTSSLTEDVTITFTIPFSSDDSVTASVTPRDVLLIGITSAITFLTATSLRVSLLSVDGSTRVAAKFYWQVIGY